MQLRLTIINHVVFIQILPGNLLITSYRKISKFLDAIKDAIKLQRNLPKIQTKRPNIGYFVKKMQLE